MPTTTNTIDYYNQNAEAFFNETIGVDMSLLYQPFLELLPEKAHILDAGCGSSRDSLYFLQNGYQVTAFDASPRMSELAANLTKIPVQIMTFEQLNFEIIFDGVWASASLLHVPRTGIETVLKRIINALKQGGIFYSSFKYGDKEYSENNRYFNCYDEQSFYRLVSEFQDLQVVKTWISDDQRKNRENEKWLNSLLRKI